MYDISDPFQARLKFHQSPKQQETPSQCIHPLIPIIPLPPYSSPHPKIARLVRRICGSSRAGHPVISEISSIDLLVVVLHGSEDPLWDVLEGAALSGLLWELLNCVHCDCFGWVLSVCEEYYWGFVSEFEVMRIDLCVCVVWIWLIIMLWCEDAVMMFWMLNWTVEGRYLSIYPSSLAVKVRGKDDFSKYY
jgi:hypothetical protein